MADKTCVSHRAVQCFSHFADPPSFKITVLPGDGIGPEIIEQAIRVLDVVTSKTSLKLELVQKDFGGIAIDNHGTALPDDTLKTCKESDAVLFGE